MKKILIANRGEIAVRVIRACADHGSLSVAIYADSDIDALHVRMADEAYALEGHSSTDSYLNIPKILAIAKRANVDGIHPGYGFLSENPEFAEAVIDAGFTWIGPSPETIRALGDKVQARQIAARVGAPLVHGTQGPVGGIDEVFDFVRTHGLPIAIKAAFGGGGRGLKVVWDHDQIAELYDSAVRESMTAFGRSECFVEQFLDCPRHIETQFIADKHGQVIVLGTRDCSLQRRHQKLLEEAPAPFLSQAYQDQMVEATKAIALATNYHGVGTVEFLLSRSGVLSFLEVNTRLQVEHTVTEEVTGIDLVIEQFRVAQGLPLSFDHVPALCGHAIEFRINAEDVGRGFLPSPGTITRFDVPMGPGVRIDTGVVVGSSVSGMFDSLMAKLVVRGSSREQALRRARRALREFSIEGVPCVLPFHLAVIDHPDFLGNAGFNVHTRWIETEFVNQIPPELRTLASDGSPLTRTCIEIDGRRVRIGLPRELWHGWVATMIGSDVPVVAEPVLSIAHDQRVIAPMSGVIRAWHVQTGEIVESGQIVGVIEAMKMETPLVAPCAGVMTYLIDVGTSVQTGDGVAKLE